jgi:hypothetical protein
VKTYFGDLPKDAQDMLTRHFIYEGYRPLGLEGSRDTIVYGMLREDCKYLPGYDGPVRRAITGQPPEHIYERVH